MLIAIFVTPMWAVCTMLAVIVAVGVVARFGQALVQACSPPWLLEIFSAQGEDDDLGEVEMSELTLRPYNPSDDEADSSH